MLFEKMLVNVAASSPTQGNLFGFGSGAGFRMGNGSVSTLTTVTQVGSTTTWTKIASCRGGYKSPGLGGNGYCYSGGIRSDNTLWMWGNNGYGQLGLGNTTDQQTPAQVTGSWLMVALAGASDAGISFTLGIQTNGTLWGWGSNDQYELGTGNTTPHTSPFQIGTDTDWAMVACCANQGGTPIYSVICAAIKTNGKLYTWGQDASGATGLGISSNTSTTTPTQVGSATDWAYVACGTDMNASPTVGNYMIAVKTTGTLWGWGQNGVYQLGLGNTTNQSSPTQIGSATNWLKVFVGTSGCSFGIKNDGTLWSWGLNANGITGLGITSYSQTQTPTQVGSATTWIDGSSAGIFGISGTDNFSLALQSDGSLWSWGVNNQYNLGNGSNSPANFSVPTQVGSGTTWIACAAGGQSSQAATAYFYSMAIKS